MRGVRATTECSGKLARHESTGLVTVSSRTAAGCGVCAYAVTLAGYLGPRVAGVEARGRAERARPGVDAWRRTRRGGCGLRGDLVVPHVVQRDSHHCRSAVLRIARTGPVLAPLSADCQQFRRAYGTHDVLGVGTRIGRRRLAVGDPCRVDSPLAGSLAGDQFEHEKSVPFGLASHADTPRPGSYESHPCRRGLSEPALRRHVVQLCDCGARHRRLPRLSRCTCRLRRCHSRIGQE